MLRFRIVLLTLALSSLQTTGLAESTTGEKGQAVRAVVAKEAAIVKRTVTDSWMTLRIKLALLEHRGMEGLDVNVRTEHRVVTLRGKVGSEAARQAAEELARAVAGEKRVLNEVVVVPRAERPVIDRRDARIVRDVRHRLRADASLRDSRIAVRSDGGIVSLTGRAASLEASVRAAEEARGVPGVQAVHNDLGLEPV